MQTPMSFALDHSHDDALDIPLVVVAVRRCTICTHPEATAIDRALIAGTPLRNIAEQFRLAVTSLHRHKNAHIPAALARAKDAADVAGADSLLARLEELTSEAHRLKGKAERRGDIRTALSAVRELVRMVELLAKLRGELDESPKVAVVALPQWQIVTQALGQYPDARLAVARALEMADD